MRRQLPATQIDPDAAKLMSSFHVDVVDEVQKAITSNHVVVVGMAQNVFCKKACAILEKHGIKFKYLEYGSYLSKWKERLALKMWSGWPTYPQIFVDGQLIGGYTDLERWINEGRLANASSKSGSQRPQA